MLCTCEDRNARVNRSVFCSSSTGRNHVYTDAMDSITRQWGFLSYNDNVKVKATCVAGTLFCCAFGKKENVNDCPLLK